MGKVFIVTSGKTDVELRNEPDEYKIEAVFSTREKAEAFINAKGISDYQVEEYSIDTENIETVESIYRVSIDITNGEISVDERLDESDDLEYLINASRVDCFKYYHYPDVRLKIIEMWLAAESLEHVKELAAERWKQIQELQTSAFVDMYDKIIPEKIKNGVYNYDYPLYNFNTKRIVM